MFRAGSPHRTAVADVAMLPEDIGTIAKDAVHNRATSVSTMAEVRNFPVMLEPRQGTLLEQHPNARVHR